MSYNLPSQRTPLLEKCQAYFNISRMCLARNNPIITLFKKIQYMIYVICTIRQKIKIVKQRVNHMKYRLHQMEELIQQNSSTHFPKGSTINQLR